MDVQNSPKVTSQPGTNPVNMRPKHYLSLMVCLMTLVQTNAQEYILEKLNAKVNTPNYDEISPLVSPDGLSIYFTRVGYPDYDRTLIEDGRNLGTIFTPEQMESYLGEVYSIIAGEPVLDPIASPYNQDIWMAYSVHGEFDKVFHPSSPINNALPNSISSLTPNPREMIVINQFVEGGGMKKGFSKTEQFADGTWSFPDPIFINNYHNSGPDVNMSLSADGSMMILALERDDAVGRSDLYVCLRTGPDSWSMPKNLGPYVNTPYRETTPFLSSDGKTLYYASDRGNHSAGGSDIFMQTRMDDSWEVWSAPKRYRFPINSRANDSHPYFNEASGYLYFTSTRDGSSDIFRIQIEEPKPTGLPIEGVVVNSETMQPVEARVIYAPKYMQAAYNIYMAQDGEFKVTIPKGVEYTIRAEKKGFQSDVVEVRYEPAAKYPYDDRYTIYIKPDVLNVSMDNVTSPINNSVALPVSNTPTQSTASTSGSVDLNEASNNLKIGAKLNLPPIFFERSKPFVLYKSYPTLDELANFLERNPRVYILISGHTDNHGIESQLRQLSEERAEAIKNYLVRKRGLEGFRIKTHGFGSKRPLNDNSSEKLRAENRRVEIEIVHIEQNNDPSLFEGNSN